MTRSELRGLIPLAKCETCGTEYRPKSQDKGRFCSLDCYYKSKAGKNRTAVVDERMRTVPDHPLAPPSGQVAESRLNLYEKLGPGAHPCHWCGETIEWMVGRGPGGERALLADHLNWDRTNNAPENLVPSCHRCNSHRTQSGRGRLIQEDEPTLPRGRGVTRAVERNCEQCGNSFLAIPAEVKKGRGRFCSRSCARRYAMLNR